MKLIATSTHSGPALRFATVTALVLSLGLHWAVLQTIAWTGMLVNYSCQGSFTEALGKTFDGKHPCCLCNAIQKGRASESKPDREGAKTALKLEVGLVWQPSVFCLARSDQRVIPSEAFAASRREAPPRPRPRNFAPANLA